MSNALKIESGSDYSYSFLMKDGKTKQNGNCTVTKITPMLISFRCLNNQILYTKKLNEVTFGPVKRRGKI